MGLLERLIDFLTLGSPRPTAVAELSDRFKRVRGLMGKNGDRPRYNAILSLTTSTITDAQQQVEGVLDTQVKRWKLDEVVTNVGKPSEMFYLVRLKRSVAKDALLTAMHAAPGTTFEAIDLEVGEALEQEQFARKAKQKHQDKALAQ